MNFLEETIEELAFNGKTETDVLWVGQRHKGQYCKTTWEDFKSKANFEYDNNRCMGVIPLDLIIVGKDFWLERGEYDGAGWWEFKTQPIEPAETKELDLCD